MTRGFVTSLAQNRFIAIDDLFPLIGAYFVMKQSLELPSHNIIVNFLCLPTCTSTHHGHVCKTGMAINIQPIKLVSSPSPSLHPHPDLVSPLQTTTTQHCDVLLLTLGNRFSGFFSAANPSHSSGLFRTNYLDGLFMCMSAMNVTGLNVVSVSQLRPAQQAFLFILMLIGDIVSVDCPSYPLSGSSSSMPVLIRRYSL